MRSGIDRQWLAAAAAEHSILSLPLGCQHLPLHHHVEGLLQFEASGAIMLLASTRSHIFRKGRRPAVQKQSWHRRLPADASVLSAEVLPVASASSGRWHVQQAAEASLKMPRHLPFPSTF